MTPPDIQPSLTDDSPSLEEFRESISEQAAGPEDPMRKVMELYTAQKVIEEFARVTAGIELVFDPQTDDATETDTITRLSTLETVLRTMEAIQRGKKTVSKQRRAMVLTALGTPSTPQLATVLQDSDPRFWLEFTQAAIAYHRYREAVPVELEARHHDASSQPDSEQIALMKNANRQFVEFFIRLIDRYNLNEDSFLMTARSILRSTIFRTRLDRADTVPESFQRGVIGPGLAYIHLFRDRGWSKKAIKPANDEQEDMKMDLILHREDGPADSPAIATAQVKCTVDEELVHPYIELHDLLDDTAFIALQQESRDQDERLDQRKLRENGLEYDVHPYWVTVRIPPDRRSRNRL